MRWSKVTVSRRRSRWAVAAGAVVDLPLVLGIALAGCGRPSPAPSTAASPRASATATASAATRWSPLPRGRVIAGAFAGPQMTITATGVYLVWGVSPPVRGVRTELARIDVASGRIVAMRQLGAVYFDQAVAAGGSLWVATSGEALLRLNPQTLSVTGRRWIGGGDNQGFAGHSLAVAGGGLWVAGGDRLLRLSLPGGAVTASVPLPGTAFSEVAANSSGTVLVVEETTIIGFGVLQRRDPATGALLAISHTVQGVAGLFVGGVVGSGVWVVNVTGLMGYVERLDATTLAPNPGTQVEGTNGITVQVADGLTWVYPRLGGPGPSFCADPSSGRVLARLKLPPQDYLLALGPHQLFYAAPAPNGNEYVEQEPLPSGCRAR